RPTPAHTTSTPFPYTTLFRSRPFRRDRGVERYRQQPVDEFLTHAGHGGGEHLVIDHPSVLGVQPAPEQLQRISGPAVRGAQVGRSEEHTSELESRFDLVCRLL